MIQVQTYINNLPPNRQSIFLNELKLWGDSVNTVSFFDRLVLDMILINAIERHEAVI